MGCLCTCSVVSEGREKGRRAGEGWGGAWGKNQVGGRSHELSVGAFLRSGHGSILSCPLPVSPGLWHFFWPVLYSPPTLHTLNATCTGSVALTSSLVTNWPNTVRKLEAQRRQGTCLRSHSKLEKKPRFLSLDIGAQSLGSSNSQSINCETGRPALTFQETPRTQT